MRGERDRHRARLGARGERRAARWLRCRRYRIIGRNMRIGRDEVDIVALTPDRRTIVIVEVKTARVASPPGRGRAPSWTPECTPECTPGSPPGGTPGCPPGCPPECVTSPATPEDWVDRRKRRCLERFATNLRRRDRLAGRRAIRFDVVAVVWPDVGRPIVRHHPAAFDCEA